MTKSKSTKSAKSTKSTKSAKPATIQITFQRPGDLPETMKVKSQTTLADLAELLNLAGYDISVNGSKKALQYTLKKGDIIRVGVKTKNG